MFDWLWDWVNGFTGWLLGLLPDFMGSGWAELSSAFGPTVQYFAWLMALDVMTTAILTAYITRFLIRRIPVIG